MKKWLIPGLEKGKYKTNSEKPIVSRVRTCAKNDGDMSKGQRSQLEGLALTRSHQQSELPNK